MRTRQGIYSKIWPQLKGVPKGSGHIFLLYNFTEFDVLVSGLEYVRGLLPYWAYFENLSRSQNSCYCTICVATISHVCSSNMTIQIPRNPVAQWTRRLPTKQKIADSCSARIFLHVRIHVSIWVATFSLGSILPRRIFIHLLPNHYTVYVLGRIRKDRR